MRCDPAALEFVVSFFGFAFSRFDKRKFSDLLKDFRHSDVDEFKLVFGKLATFIARL